MSDFKARLSDLFPASVANFLGNRLKTEAEFNDFIDENFEKHANTFFLNPVVNRISERIIRGMNEGNRFLFFVDYDADGLNSGAIFLKMAEFIGLKHRVQVSNRGWGYGLTRGAMEDVFGSSSLDYDILITADLGSNDVEGVKWLARNIGDRMDVIITDHHLVGEDNVAEHVYALFNPQVSMEEEWAKKVCGASVAMMIALDVMRKLDMPWEKYAELFKIYAGIATITDVMPMNIGFNRHLVKHAINMFNKPANMPFVKVMLANGKIDEMFFGFTLGPMLNALSRMNEDTMMGLRFLTSRDENEVSELFVKMKGINEKRKALSALLTEYAMKEACDDPNEVFVFKIDPAILPDEFRMDLSGLNGLVAGKVSSETGKPALVFSVKQDGTLSGSGRSPSFSIIDVLKAVENRFGGFRYGGHHNACGMKIEEKDYEFWRQCVHDVSREMVRKDKGLLEKHEVVDYDEIGEFDKLNDTDFMRIMSFAPFGHMFPPLTLEGDGTVSRIQKQTLKYKAFFMEELDIVFKAFNVKDSIETGDRVFVRAKLSNDSFSGGYFLMCENFRAKKLS